MSLTRRVFVVGSRTDSRGSFLCLSKEKNPKEKTPGFRLNPALLAFCEGFRRTVLGPAKTSGFLAAPLSGLFRQKLRCSGRNNGIKLVELAILVAKSEPTARQAAVGTSIKYNRRTSDTMIETA